MPELTDAGMLERREDGTLVFTHGHRFPDNRQRVVQEYDAAGQLRFVRVELTGFAGKILDVTATVGEDGQVVKEEGYRAPEVTITVQELIKPLPVQVGAAPVQGMEAPGNVPAAGGAASEGDSDGLRAELERIYGSGKS